MYSYTFICHLSSLLILSFVISVLILGNLIYYLRMYSPEGEASVYLFHFTKDDNCQQARVTNFFVSLKWLS